MLHLSGRMVISKGITYADANNKAINDILLLAKTSQLKECTGIF